MIGYPPENKNLKTKWANPPEWEYVYICDLDIMNLNEFSMKFILQDLGYPLFGVFELKPDYAVYEYSREYEIETNRYKFGYRLKDFQKNFSFK